MKGKKVGPNRWRGRPFRTEEDRAKMDCPFPPEDQELTDEFWDLLTNPDRRWEIYNDLESDKCFVLGPAGPTEIGKARFPLLKDFPQWMAWALSALWILMVAVSLVSLVAIVWLIVELVDAL